MKNVVDHTLACFAVSTSPADEMQAHACGLKKSRSATLHHWALCVCVCVIAVQLEFNISLHPQSKGNDLARVSGDVATDVKWPLHGRRLLITSRHVLFITHLFPFVNEQIMLWH